jgi:hypothetical protein
MTWNLAIIVGLGLWCITWRFNNISVISWRPILLVEEPVVPAVSHWHTLSHNVVSNTPRLSGIRTHITVSLVVIGTYCIGSYKSNYHMTTATKAPAIIVYYVFHSVKFCIPLCSTILINNKLVRTLSYSIFQQMCINFHEYWKLKYKNFALFKGKWSIKIYLHGIMKRNFTNILKRTIISHRNSLNTKRPWHMTFEIQVLSWDI